jgi:hypothetical protein
VTICGDESKALNGVWSWVVSEGGSSPKVKLSETIARTVVTSELVHGTVQEGETIFSIPIQCLMHPAAAINEPRYGKAFAALSREVDERTILVYFLAVERELGASSRWAPYINALPAEVLSPLCWSRAELRQLAGTRLEGAVKGQREALRQQTEVWVPFLLARLREQLDLLPPGAAATERSAAADTLAVAERALTPDRVVWARSCVWSRAFSLYLNGTRTAALVPLGDLLDHSSGARVEWHTDDAAGTFTIISHQTIPLGGAVYNNYGERSNEELLLGYGFVIEENPADTLHVQLAASGKLDAGDDAHEAQHNGEEPAAREALLRRCGLCSNFSLRLDDPLPSALFNAARMYLMSPAAAAMYTPVTDEIWAPHDANDMSGDLCSSFRAVQALVRLLTADLERLRSSREPVVDSSLPDGPVRACVVKMATTYRDSQLKIAAAALEALRERSQHLTSKLGMIEQERVAASSEMCGWLARDATGDPKAREECELAYRTWETELGVQKVAVEELPIASRGANMLGAGVGGLRVTSPVVEGGLLGSTPMEAVLLADRALLLNSCGGDEQAALAATLMAQAEQHADDGWGPFARWLLSAPTTAAAFDEDVLAILGNTPLGHEARGSRQAYDEEFTALTATGMLIHWRDKAALSDLYARARAVVERHAFRLPRQSRTLQPSIGGRLALAPFVGSLPRALDDVAGVFSWAHRQDATGTGGNRGWCLELRAACQLNRGALLVVPLEGSDEETRLLEVGSGAASFPLVPSDSLMRDGGKILEPSNVDASSTLGVHSPERLSISPWNAVEILMEPADEDDELRRRKKALLHDVGLGEAHYLTLPPAPGRLCAALAVCGAESYATLEVVQAALIHTFGKHPTANVTTSIKVDECNTGNPTGGSGERICMPMPGHGEEGSSASHIPLATTGQHNDSRVELNAAPATGASPMLQLSTNNVGVCRRARKAARTLLRRLLGHLPKGTADAASLWEQARHESALGNEQRASALVYLAQHRATIESWLEALTTPVGGVGEKRRRANS